MGNDMSGARGTMVFAAFLLGLASACFLPPGVRAAEAGFCKEPDVNKLVNLAAQDALEPDRLIALVRRFNTAPPDCDSRIAYCVGMKAALQTVERAYSLLVTATPDLASARAMLLQGRANGAPWQLLVALGDVEAALARQDAKPALYHDAASDLQFAINAINEPSLCPEFNEIRPDPDEIRRIRKRTAEAVLLSPRFDIARTKQGDCGGIFLDVVKGVDAEAVPVPITFEYNKAEFTEEGKKAADSLLLCLREKKLPEITLTGHTDTHGKDAYNLDLSARRLITVEAFLRAGGYTGKLHLIPKGMREPFQPDDPTQHSADELDQMNRRVELREVKS